MPARILPQPVIPVLEGEGVVLRPWRDDDADHAALGSLDEEARTYIGPMLPGRERAAYRDWVRSRQEKAAAGAALNWCIADRRDDAALGWIGLFDLDDPFARGTGQVGYWLLPEGRGRGAVGEALGLVRAHAFDELGLHRLWATTDWRNGASQRALLRAGWRWYATESQSSVHEDGGERHDTPVFELLSDPERQAAPPPPAPPAVRDAPLRRPALVVPTLPAGDLVLRPWRHEDAPRIVQACTDPITLQYLPDLPQPYGTAEAVGYVDDMRLQAALGRTAGWCVADAGTDRVLGAIALSRLRAKEGPEAGYWTHPDARGRGVMSRALRAVCVLALTPTEDGGLGLHRVWLEAAAGNPASQAVARRAGLTEVGRDRRAERLRDGTVDDFVRFDVLAGEIVAGSAGQG